MKLLGCLIIPLVFWISCCNNNSSVNPESRNITGNKGGVSKVVSTPRRNGQMKYSAQAMKLNEEAILLINEGTERSYLDALKLIDQAISIDTTYHLSYSNKGNLLIKLKKYDYAILVYKHLTTSVKPDSPEALMMLGLLYEKTGKRILAEEYYQKAISVYSSRIIKKKDIFDMVNRAHLIFIMDNKKGLFAIDSLISVYPNNNDLMMYKEYMFINYNHKQALNDL